MNTEPEQTHEEDGEGYCYHCGYYHKDESHGNWPAPGCDDYEPKESETWEEFRKFQSLLKQMYEKGLIK